MSKEKYIKVPLEIKEENGQIIVFNEEYNLSGVRGNRRTCYRGNEGICCTTA